MPLVPPRTFVVSAAAAAEVRSGDGVLWAFEKMATATSAWRDVVQLTRSVALIVTLEPPRMLTNDGSNCRLYAWVETSLGSCAETRDDVGFVSTKLSVSGTPMGAGPVRRKRRLGTDTTRTFRRGTPSHLAPPMKSFPSPVLW